LRRSAVIDSQSALQTDRHFVYLPVSLTDSLTDSRLPVCLSIRLPD